MSESVDIKDRESLKAWLEDQPREVSVWIAFRAAARVLPLWWDAVLREEWARDLDVTALPVLRITLISVVAATAAQFRYSQTAYAAREAIYREITTASHGMRKRPSVEIMGLDSAISTVAAVAEVTYTEATAISGAASATETSTEVVEYASAVWTSVRADVEQVALHGIPDAFPLWTDGTWLFSAQWQAIKWQVANSEGSEDWHFWIEWYESLLAGRPMLGDAGRTWEMLEQIALIDPATWDRGPEVVNPVIREIWELHRLRAEVSALQAEKAAFLAARASEAQRGHNQPPEGLVDDAPEVARQITIIWDGLDEAREELERDAPDKGRLRAIAERMLAALNAVVAYCGKVADKTVTSAAEAAGKLAGRAAVVAAIDQVANNGRLMQFAKDLLAFGGG